TTSASTPYFVDSKISKINVVGDNRISYLGSNISGVSEYYGFPGDLDIYGDGQFNFASGRNGPDSYAVNGNVTVKDNATILLFSYYAAVNGTLTVPMNQAIYTAGRINNTAGEWTMLNGVKENVSNYTNKYVKTEQLSRGALCFTNEKEGKTIYNTVPVKPFTMFDVKGGVAPYSYSATSLPSGLAIDAETGYISGTSKNNNSNTTVTFTVTDAMGREVSTDMELAVKNPTLNLTICGGSNEKSAKLYNWSIAQNTSLEEGQLCLVESDFDFEETLISIPKNQVFLDTKGNTYAKNIALTDGVKYAFPYEVEAQSVSYTRSFSDKVAGKWQCLYVPFDITITEELLKDFEFAKLYMISYKDANDNGEIEDGEPLVMLLMKQTEGKVLHANTPYFIKAKTSGTKSIEVESATLKPVENGTVYCCTTEHEYTLTGINNTFNVIGNYTLNTSGQFSYYTVNQNIKPNRWYMQVNSLTGADDENAAKARQIILMVDGEDDTTGIMDITSGSKTSTAEGVFTLDGRKINDTENLSRGIYIKNGKKIMVK
ncbi:MAG: Ig domain-containing protein, partial [Prevotellaceae bacterium]|nr:Ig domain-containing protein [Prevotellaceae bacterium]